MYKSCIFLIILIFHISCNNNGDSLRKLLLEKGVEMHNNGEYEKAKSIYFSIINNTVEIDSTTLRGMYILIGNSYEEQDSLDHAKEYYFKAKEIDEFDWEIWTNLGNYYARINQKDKSDNYYLKALKFKPNDNLLLTQAALIHFEKDNKKLALELINKSLAIDSLDESTILVKSMILNEK